MGPREINPFSHFHANASLLNGHRLPIMPSSPFPLLRIWRQCGEKGWGEDGVPTTKKGAMTMFVGWRGGAQYLVVPPFSPTFVVLLSGPHWWGQKNKNNQISANPNPPPNIPFLLFYFILPKSPQSHSLLFPFELVGLWANSFKWVSGSERRVTKIASKWRHPFFDLTPKLFIKTKVANVWKGWGMGTYLADCFTAKPQFWSMDVFPRKWKEFQFSGKN